MIDQLRWRFVGATGRFDDLSIDGCSLVGRQVRSTGRSVRYRTARFPMTPYQFDIYQVELAGSTREFAATELSPGVFGHLVPRWR